MNHSCSYTTIYFARAYDLSDFGIDGTDEFTITHGEIGLSYAEWGALIQFKIYAIDSNFPESFDESNILGQSQVYDLPYFSYSGFQAGIFTVAFETPVVIPADVDRILVEVEKGVGSSGSGLIHVAGTLDDNDVSYYKRCTAGLDYISTEDFTHSSLYPGSDYNFYITAIEDFTNIDIPFRAYTPYDCTGLTKEFKLTNPLLIQNATWDFGDPASGSENSSNGQNPTHTFSEPGNYTITTTVTNFLNETFVTTKTLNVQESNTQIIFVDDIYACEDTYGSGISTNFDTSGIEDQITNGETGIIINYYDQNGNELPNPLPNPFTNTVPNSQTITVRKSDSSNGLCCFSETTFNLITLQAPEIIQIDDLYSCDNDGDGFGLFDLNYLINDLMNGQTNMTVELFDSNNNFIEANNYSDFENIVTNQDYVIAIISDDINGCTSETNINLIIDESPVANQPEMLYGCDDNNDGISEYFNTSNIESQILNGQTGVMVNYFDDSGTELPSPLPNPYTNTDLYNQNIIVRVTNLNSNCYAETTLQLQTITQPSISQPDNLYACDQGNGYSEFDTSTVIEQVIGSQTGLNIHFFDSNFHELPSPLPISFENTEPYIQTIYIRVEDSTNPICYSETSFDLIINDLPIIELEDEYFICDLEPSIYLEIDSTFNSYEWYFEDGTLISTVSNSEVIEEGNYTVVVTNLENGIACENTFTFRLIRSALPEIIEVNFGELGNNFIEIIAVGNGDFEYSIDGINYQTSNYFSNVQGGVYNVQVRDRDGCGEDSKEVTLIDYPKFFTPNNDGNNDVWQIKGIITFPNSIISIYDRYGKLVKQLNSESLGWDGTFNGTKMPTSDYWFNVLVGNGKVFNGHFTLKR